MSIIITMRLRAAASSLAIIISSFFLFSTSTADPDLLLDFCVADCGAAVSRSDIHLNGHPCIDPALATSAHFATSALSKPSSSSAHSGFYVTTTNATTLPGGNAQGLAMSRSDIAAGSLVPPHAHPRAAEAALLLQGVTVLAGFVDTAGRLYAQQLRPGDAFVFPRGLVHFIYNQDAAAPAVLLSGFDSQNPGALLAPLAVLGSPLPFPDEVLQKAFESSGQDLQKIQRNLGGGI